MLTPLPKGIQTKLLKFFCLKVFSICHRCRKHRWQTLSCEYLREFSKIFETALIVWSEAWGKLIQEKNQKQKISWHCPFKLRKKGFLYRCDEIYFYTGLVTRPPYINLKSRYGPKFFSLFLGTNTAWTMCILNLMFLLVGDKICFYFCVSFLIDWAFAVTERKRTTRWLTPAVILQQDFSMEVRIYE